MPRIKKAEKAFEESNEKIIQRFLEKEAIGSVKFNPGRLTKELLAAIAFYASAVLVILILFFSANSFISVFLKERTNPGNLSASNNIPVYKPSGDIIYSVDKPKYGLNEKIGLSIINESDKSIFLAPCQYFNEFEKKELNSWKPLVINNCEEIADQNSNNFEKIPLRENQSISAMALGVGVWRGVSDIYMDCQKTEVGACKSKEIIYSDEFAIEAPKN